MMYKLELGHTPPELNGKLAAKIAKSLLVNNRHNIKVYDGPDSFTIVDQLESKRLFSYKHNEREFIYLDKIQMLVFANLPNQNSF